MSLHTVLRIKIYFQARIKVILGLNAAQFCKLLSKIAQQYATSPCALLVGGGGEVSYKN